jgi:ethanolamine ammonia-lyase small subunit
MSEESPRELPKPIDLDSKGDVIPEWLLRWKDSTPARVFVGRAGSAYRTTSHLELRADHAAARDAVHADVEISRDFDERFAQQYDLFQVNSAARTKQEYLLRPDLGRSLSEEAKEELRSRREPRTDLQIVIGDGLSATAVIRQIPVLLPLVFHEAKQLGLRVGLPFLVRHCRVGVLNDIGEILQPDVVLLLIGERPGLVTAESLSAYMAYQPRTGHTDAQRNLISNIHSRGVLPADAARRILALASQLRERKKSGVEVKEELPSLPLSKPPLLDSP